MEWLSYPPVELVWNPSDSIADFDNFRNRDVFAVTADEWIREHRTVGYESGVLHNNLTFWCHPHPHTALALILVLLDKTEDDDDTQESIAMTNVEFLVDCSPDDFLPFLAHAVQTHHRFALCTQWHREHPPSGRWYNRWKQLQELIVAKQTRELNSDESVG